MHPKRGKAVVGAAIVAGPDHLGDCGLPGPRRPGPALHRGLRLPRRGGDEQQPDYGESRQGSGQARQNAKSYLRSQGLNLSDAEADKALYSACGVGQMPKGLTAGQYATIFYGANKYFCP